MPVDLNTEEINITNTDFQRKKLLSTLYSSI